VRDYQHRESVARDLVDGQRHAVERDRALGRDVTHELRRCAQRDSRHLGQVIACNHGREPISVTCDQVAAQFVAELECAFEIDFRSMAPTASRGEPQGLGGGIDREPGAAVLLARADHGQADAGAGDRGAFDDRGALVATGDLEPAQALRARVHMHHLADVGHNPGEHETPFSRAARRGKSRLAGYSFGMLLRLSTMGLTHASAFTTALRNWCQTVSTWAKPATLSVY